MMDTVNTIDNVVDQSVETMTDREISEETLRHLRHQREVVTKLIDDMMNSPLGAMIKGGSNPLAAMFGGGRRQ